VKAIRFSALDYLLKPIDPEELEVALNRARQAMLRRSTPTSSWR
jgi:two-component system LytT family response regulator